MRGVPLSVLSSVLVLCATTPAEAQEREPSTASAFRAREMPPPSRQSRIGLTFDSKRRVETGTVRGLVTEATTGAPVAGARVTIALTQLAANTGADGRFTIVNVPAG